MILGGWVFLMSEVAPFLLLHALRVLFRGVSAGGQGPTSARRGGESAGQTRTALSLRTTTFQNCAVISTLEALVSLSLRLTDLLGPMPRVKKKGQVALSSLVYYPDQESSLSTTCWSEPTLAS